MQDKVDELVSEASNRLIDTAYGQDRLIRDRLLQKTRKIFFEIVSNAVEHAYVKKEKDQPENGYVGIYARMRSQLPSNSGEATMWHHLIKAEAETCPTIDRFEPNPLAPWIEIFICDTGEGLFAHWRDFSFPGNSDKEIEKIYNGIKKDLEKDKIVDILRRFVRILFSVPFSRISNRSESRSSVTGLLLLGIMLRQDSDFTRIYTGGEWDGSRHPWQKDHSTHGYLNLIRHVGLDKKSCARGTWFSFSIQPDQLKLEYPKERWVIPSGESRRLLIRGLNLPPLKIDPAVVRFEDRRLDQFCKLPEKWDKIDDLQNEKVFETTPVVVLRPPRSLQKKQLEVWLTRLADSSKSLGQGRTGCFLMVDLSPFQAITYAELIALIKLDAPSKLDIYLVTEDWAICCFSKTAIENLREGVLPQVRIEKARQFLINPCEDLQQVSALGIQQLLRYADSAVFWTPLEFSQSLPSDVYFKGTVFWSSSYDYSESNNTEKKDIPIKGYLDISRALADFRRYQACHRALRRCLNLFPEYDALAGDDFVNSITLDADRGRKRAETSEHEKQPNKKVIIGSIHVTSSTVNRFLKRAGIPSGSQELYLLNHPDAPVTSPAVLDWLPPVSDEIPDYDTIIYRRIPNTPYIGAAGERTALFPRFRASQDGSEELTESLYPRTPAQTYEDFHVLDVLRMGHWVYAKSHDLLTINLYRALELSNLDNGPLMEWLVEKVKTLCLDNCRWKPNMKVLYPSHALSDYTVSLLKQRLSREIAQGDDHHSIHTDLENNVIPLNFLTSTTVSPYRISPLSYDRLRKAISAPDQEQLPVHVILLDDGAKSGRTFKELEQLALALGAEKVDFIALIDRTGLPIYVDHVEDYLKTHHCFWRWDVPTLGYRHSCPLCIALENTAFMQKDYPYTSMQSRLRFWREQWKPVEVVSHWENNGLKPRLLDKKGDANSHSFGIYHNGSHTAVHTVNHKTSTGITAAIAEITFSSSRSYYARRKARELVAQYSKETGIEILSAQILLFFDELDYWAKVDIFCDLLAYLWECKTDSETTALAGLCLTLVDNDILPEVWPRFKANQLCKERVHTIDARISAESLRTRYNRLCLEEEIHALDNCSENPSEAEQYNYLVMSANDSTVPTIARIFEIVGETPKSLHNMGLQKCLDSIKQALQDNNSAKAFEYYRLTCNLLERLFQAYQELDIRFFNNIKQKEEDLEMLNSIINTSIDLSRKDGPELMKKWLNRTDRTILAEKGFAEHCRSEFIFLSDTSTNMGAFLTKLQIVTDFKAKWPLICLDKIGRNGDITSRWRNNGTFTLPNIVGTDRHSKWTKEIPIYCDRYVKQCLFEVLANCVHVETDIYDPWEKKPVNDDFLTVEFVNACNAEAINLNPTEASSSLERMGGGVICYVIKKSQEKVEEISPQECPLALQEYVGLPVNQRIAVAVVRIPTMKTIKKRKDDGYARFNSCHR